MRVIIASAIMALIFSACGVSSNNQGWSAGMGVCTQSWAVGSCNSQNK